MVTRRVPLAGTDEAVVLFGPHDRNLRDIEKRFQVQLFVRPSDRSDQGGLTLAVRGRPKPVEQAVALLREMKKTAARSPHGTVEVPAAIGEGAPAPAGSVLTTVTGTPVRPRTPAQTAYVRALTESDLVFAVGPAGTGKTFLAVACAVAALERGTVSRLVLTRPVVEAGEKLGFLPGDLYEKVHPYLAPLYAALQVMVGADRFRQWRDDDMIEIVPLAYMRGRTLEDAFVILDEAQNTTPDQMKMCLTRLGTGSRMVVTGDVTQIDLDKSIPSGLVVARDILHGIDGVAFLQFTDADVCRHPLVRRILLAWEAWRDRRRPGGPA